MAKTRESCNALSLRRTGDDLHVSFHEGFKIRLAGIVPVSLEFTAPLTQICDQAQIPGLAIHTPLQHIAGKTPIGKIPTKTVAKPGFI